MTIVAQVMLGVLQHVRGGSAKIDEVLQVSHVVFALRTVAKIVSRLAASPTDLFRSLMGLSEGEGASSTGGTNA